MWGRKGVNNFCVMIQQKHIVALCVTETTFGLCSLWNFRSISSCVLYKPSRQGLRLGVSILLNTRFSYLCLVTPFSNTLIKN